MRVTAAGGMEAVFRDAVGPPERPNVILLTVDSLRADRMGCLSDRPTLTPNLDRLAKESVCFTKAIAPAPWTKPSVSSLLTGLYPSAHGAISRGAYGARVTAETDPARANVVRSAVLTLAERLTADGYATAALTGGGFTHQAIQGRGFTDFDSEGWGLPDLFQRFTRWLADGPRAPFFVWIHGFDTHRPYRGRLAPSRHLRRRPFTLTNSDVKAINSGRIVLTPRQVAHLTDLYDAGVQRMDRRIGTLLRALATSGLLSSTVLVFTSDHGEALYEHRLVEHSDVVYNEVLRVPLLIRAAGFRPQTVGQYVRLIDLAPTLMEMVGSPLPPMQGRSLLPVISDGEDLHLTAFSELEMAGSPRALQLTHAGRDWKMIRWTQTGDAALFDLTADPGEKHDLCGEGNPVEEVLQVRLDAQVQENEAWTRELERGGRFGEGIQGSSDEIADRLRDLGYID